MTVKNKVTAAVIFGAILVSIGFLVGRKSAHPQVITKTQTITKVQQQIVYQDRVKYITQTQTKYKTVKVEVKAKDGSDTITTTTEAQKDQETQKDKAATETAQTSSTTNTLSLQKPAQPSWHLSGSLGYAFPSLYQQTPGLNLRGAVVGLQVERRVLGPLFLGLRVDSALNISGVIGGEF